MLAGLDPRPMYAGVMFLTDAYNGQWVGVAESPISDTGKKIQNLCDAVDRVVPDGYWWQMLSDTHRDRLGGWPSGTELLDGGTHGVLTFGTAHEWADPETRHTPQTAARAALAPIIVHDAKGVIVAKR
jgi:hypothetical protein